MSTIPHKAPIVVYTLVQARNSTVGFKTALESELFILSVATSLALHRRVFLMADAAWTSYLRELFGMDLMQVFTGFYQFENAVAADPPTEEQLQVFWSTYAKTAAIEWALTISPDSFIILDADALLLSDFSDKWSDTRSHLITAWHEPASWEPYAEGHQRLGDLMHVSVATALYAHRPRPIHLNEDLSPEIHAARNRTKYALNTGVIAAFKCARFMRAYSTAMKTFMARFFNEGNQPRAMDRVHGSSTSGTEYFTELMIGEQLMLSVLLELGHHFSDAAVGSAKIGYCGWPALATMTEFKDRSAEHAAEYFSAPGNADGPLYPHLLRGEYPLPSPLFFHLWKAKQSIEPWQADAIRSYLAAVAGTTAAVPSVLARLGFAITRRSIPMLPSSYISHRLARITVAWVAPSAVQQ